MPKCSSCKWYGALRDHKNAGECRAAPPVVIPISPNNKETVWPVVFRDEWCGKHRAK